MSEKITVFRRDENELVFKIGENEKFFQQEHYSSYEGILACLRNVQEDKRFPENYIQDFIALALEINSLKEPKP